MDEVPIKAGRQGQGKMQQTYYWPLYGEEDEVAFTWSTSRGPRKGLHTISERQTELKVFPPCADGHPPSGACFAGYSHGTEE